MKKITHIPLYRKIAKQLGLTTTPLTTGGDFKYSLLISDSKKVFLIATRETGFYPDTQRWFTALANSKILSQQVLKQLGYKTIPSVFIDWRKHQNITAVLQACKKIKYPALIKPEVGNKGRGIVIVNDATELKAQCQTLLKQQTNFMVQKIVYGTEYRILMVAGTVYVMHAKEFPYIEANGKKTVRELLAKIPKSEIDKNFLAAFMKQASLRPSSTPEKGLKIPYNITRKGSQSYYKTDSLPKVVTSWTKQLAKKLNTATIGLDVFVPDDFSATDQYQIIEINASPGFGYLGVRYKDRALVERICRDVLKQYFNLR